MLKPYYDKRNLGTNKATVVVAPAEQDSPEETTSDTDIGMEVIRLKNSDILNNLNQKLKHLPNTKRKVIEGLLQEFVQLFPDVPGWTTAAIHDVDVGEATPIKQHAYRVNPIKRKCIRKEVEYMLQNGIVEPSQSQWSSPCVLVPKPDGSFRFCTDFRKVNSVTKPDCHPLPRIDDCIDQIGSAQFVSKFDLLKGYWQVPLSARAQEISAFVTPDGLYQYTVMPFGMRNAPATFQHMINSVVSGLEGCAAYIDDVVIYSHSWDQHVSQLRSLFSRLREANLTVNLRKSEFCHAKITFLGHIVGLGQVAPVTAKIEAVCKFPVPVDKRELMRFLGMAGYYRKFCPNYSMLTEPLTALLKKGEKFLWSSACQNSFDKVKSFLLSEPVLMAPNFEKQFKLFVDASDIGMGAVLLQEDSSGVDHPVCYYSKKIDSHQCNYSTVEKETLALILSLQHFEVYLSSTTAPVEVFT